MRRDTGNEAIGEQVQLAGDTVDDFQLPAPTYELIEPKTAPSELLAQVIVNTEAGCLEANTPLGKILVKLNWKMDEDPDSEETKGDFFAALDSGLDPDAVTNPLPTQEYPYSILTNGALYEVKVLAPLEAVQNEWSEERQRNIGGIYNLFGISLAEFKRVYPRVDVGDLPEGKYNITATERTRPTLAIAARLEAGEPVTCMQTVEGDSVHYSEKFTGGFQQSIHQPDTGVAIINSRTTIRGNGEDADMQRLEFTEHDGLQRTGSEAKQNSGLVELIVFQATEIQWIGFTFEQTKLFNPSQAPSGTFGDRELSDGSYTYRSDVNFPTSGSGLGGGETRYRPPETVKVSMGGVTDCSPIAAFRFALASANEAAA